MYKKVYVDECMSRTRTYEWFTRFKNRREGLNDDASPGRTKGENRVEFV